MLNNIVFWIFGIILIPLLLWHITKKMQSVMMDRIFIKYKLNKKTYTEHSDSKIFGHELIFLSIGILLAGIKIFLKVLDTVAILEEGAKVLVFLGVFLLYLYAYAYSFQQMGTLDRKKEAQNYVHLIPWGSNGFFKIQLNTFITLFITILGIFVYTLTIFGVLLFISAGI